jgi:translation initiation factor 6
MSYKQTSVNGEDFVGLLGLATDKYALISTGFKDARILEVPTVKTNIYGTNLLGMFCAGNSNGLLVPYFIEDEKISWIKKQLKEHGVEINIEKVHDTYTALGNLVCSNDKAAIVSREFTHHKIFEDALDVEVVKKDIARHKEAGACCKATNKGFLAHAETTADELKEIEKILKVPGKEGTINFGFPFIGSGLIANSHGYITGMRTSGIELGAIDDALGFF